MQIFIDTGPHPYYDRITDRDWRYAPGESNETDQKMARQKVASVSTDVQNMTLSWNFTDGKQVTLNCAELSDEMKVLGMLHGFKQKGSDSYAEAAGDVAAARGMLEDVLAAIRAGEWRQKSEGVGSTVLVPALVEFYRRKGKAVTQEQAQAKFDSLDDKQRAELRQAADIVRIIAELNLGAKRKSADDILGDIAA